VTELREIVGTHQPDEASPRKAAFQRAQRVGGVTRAQPRLDIGNPDALVADDRRGGCDAVGERRHAVDRLQRILRRDEPPDLVELEMAQRLAADVQVAAMGRVERAAEQADTSPAAIAERGGERKTM